RENIPRATSARTSSKKKPALRSGPRGAQSHLTERENIPRATGAKCRSKRPDENYSFPARTQFFKVQ
uniref:hypothetical protein n=1 Tax=Faecalibacterium prausnitzii TaxID=853 RepID=UPI003FED7454